VVDEVPSDATLMGLVAVGDEAAFEELYRRHAPWLQLRLDRRCSDPGVVDEALQDAFAAVWLWGIAMRRLVDTLRRQPAAGYAQVPEGRVASAEDEVLLSVQFGDLQPALDRLSPELKVVVQAMVVDGLTAAETGRLLGVPQGTVKTRIRRAKGLLREALA
jgi:RNA polymerase sigma-70 factor (ECF subfamily)